MVIVIIGILAAIAVPMFLGQRDRARDANTREAGRTIAIATQLYMLDEVANPGATPPAAANKATAVASLRRAEDPGPQNLYEGADMSRVGDAVGDYDVLDATRSAALRASPCTSTHPATSRCRESRRVGARRARARSSAC